MMKLSGKQKSDRVGTDCKGSSRITVAFRDQEQGAEVGRKVVFFLNTSAESSAAHLASSATAKVTATQAWDSFLSRESALFYTRFH